MSVNLGSIIWTAVRAILKFVLTAACGTFLARAKLLDARGTRAISQCILNVFLPSLVFTKIVQGIDQGKIKQVGVLVLTAILYTVLGLFFGVLVRTFTKVPKSWKYGVLATGAFSNWGDLPLVLIGTIVTSAPFDGTQDQAKGLAYVSVYLFCQTTIMFALNGVWLIKKDFEESEEEDSVGTSGSPGRSANVLSGFKRHLHSIGQASKIRASGKQDTTNESDESIAVLDDNNNNNTSQQDLTKISTNCVSRKISRRNSASRAWNAGEALSTPQRDSSENLYLRPIVSGVLEPGDIHSTIELPEITRAPSTLPTHQTQSEMRKETVSSEVSTPSLNDDDKDRPPQTSGSFKKWAIVKTQAKAALFRFLTPPSLSVIIGMVIAVVPQLKALFVTVADVNMPAAPDGTPPLDFLIDTTSFIGNAAVPCSLLILGYSLSRLKVTQLPTLRGAIVMAILKMIVLPIIAVAWMGFLASPRGFIDPTDLVLRLVLVLPAAVPTATSLIYITSIFAPEGGEENVQYIGVFLIVQYLFVGVTLTITVVYTLNIIT